MASSKRDQLVNTALALFYREGFHATGIDRILAESGVAKMTLYNHFKSKDELIVAALESRFAPAAQRMAWAFEHLPPREAIGKVFEGLDALIRGEDFCGCAFINAAAEFHDRDHPVRRLSASYKAATLRYFRDALERLGAQDPEKLARQLQYLMEGAISMAHIQGPAGQALEAWDAADQLMLSQGL
ncbi:TetR/AcrR family transcriptional regulator [Metapseudomonas furukawaii]|jgi:AcrR family transcriptional regulator|uniref:Transcriptional regulator n=1 Tax=Metapseudomonas furukawaii TaxID=1149133 RepID=A0AAD1FGI5_METFU|nr:TetR family transcriptional regulator [Pseudomonas furukawaii]ELS28591.1 Transcriptional regulator, TetR family [Pseudomonas furukawaii]BAU75177.1 transcriptional regulator [Pseudomonas furukawaii]